MANPEKKLVTQFTVLVSRASLQTDHKQSVSQSACQSLNTSDRSVKKCEKCSLTKNSKGKRRFYWQTDDRFEKTNQVLQLVKVCWFSIFSFYSKGWNCYYCCYYCIVVVVLVVLVIIEKLQLSQSVVLIRWWAQCFISLWWRSCVMGSFHG